MRIYEQSRAVVKAGFDRIEVLARDARSVVAGAACHSVAGDSANLA